MLEIENLHLWRGDRHLLKGLNLAVQPGQVVQLLWPNGTGKTSLIRCIAGFLHAEEGQVRWKGEPTQRSREIFHADLAYLGYETALKPDLTVIENLQLACAMRSGASMHELVATLERLGLPRVAHAQTVRTLSAGQQRRSALARLALWDAALWLLDEPASNLDPGGQQALSQLLSEHCGRGGIVLVATHQMLQVPGVESRLWHSPELRA